MVLLRVHANGSRIVLGWSWLFFWSLQPRERKSCLRKLLLSKSRSRLLCYPCNVSKTKTNGNGPGVGAPPQTPLYVFCRLNKVRTLNFDAPGNCCCCCFRSCCWKYSWTQGRRRSVLFNALQGTRVHVDKIMFTRLFHLCTPKQIRQKPCLPFSSTAANQKHLWSEISERCPFLFHEGAVVTYHVIFILTQGKWDKGEADHKMPCQMSQLIRHLLGDHLHCQRTNLDGTILSPVFVCLISWHDDCCLNWMVPGGVHGWISSTDNRPKKEQMRFCSLLAVHSVVI